MRTTACALLLLLAACSKSTDTPPAGTTPAGDRVKVISRGEAVKPEDFLVAGSVTILDFYADW